MSSPSIHAVDTPQARIRFLEYGRPSGIPVLCLHGFPDSPVAYREVIRHLDLDDLHLYVPWLRGFGETEVTSPDLVSGQDAALGHDLLSFADALGLRRFHVVGHDWGAHAAYAAAVLAPNRVVSLFTLASPYGTYGGREVPPEEVRAHWYQWFFQLEQGRKALSRDAVGFCHELWRSWSPEWSFAEADFREAAEAWSNPQFVDTVLSYYRNRWGGALSLRAYAEMQERLDARPKPKILPPTVYVQGGADACDLPESSIDQAGQFSGPYERVLLEGAGHFPHREDPQAVAALLKKHLESNI